MASTYNPFSIFFKQLFCNHWYTTNLVFSGGKKTHHEIKKCIKCGKRHKVFSGTRKEWYEYKNLGKPL